MSIGELYMEFLDTTMDKLPLRKRDGARVVDTGRNTSRIYCEPSGVTYMKRYEVWVLSSWYNGIV